MNISHIQLLLDTALKCDLFSSNRYRTYSTTILEMNTTKIVEC